MSGQPLVSRLKQIWQSWGSPWDQIVMGTLLIALAGMMTYLLWPHPQYELALTPLPETAIQSEPVAMSAIKAPANDITSNPTSKPKHHHRPKKPKIVLKPASIAINTATAAQLDLLPGVGPKMAQRILAYRKANGAFASLDDLQNVKGIGPKNFAKIKPFLKI